MGKTFPIILSAILFLLTLNFQVSAAPLTVLQSNPRYFTDGSGKAVYLTGSHTWNNLQDNGISDPPPVFDYNKYLNFMQSYNHNFMRMWVTEVSKNMGNPVILSGWWVPNPFARTGPGNALDGKPKFNLTQFNQSYFDRLRARVIAARDKGIYVSIMLFEEWGQEPWTGHPFNINNNINGIDGDPGGDGDGRDLAIHTLQISAVTNIQKAYIRKVIDTVNDLDNVLYEIANEATAQSTSWQYELINYIKSYESGKPKQHPVGMTFQGQDPKGTNSNLFNSLADWISPGAADGYDSNPPAATGAKVIIIDTDHSCPLDYREVWIWKCFLRGLNPILMDFYDYGDPKLYSSGWYSVAEQEDMRKQMGYTLTYANKMNLVSMTPRGDLASTGYALANPGQEYLVYQPSNGSFTVSLQAGTYSYEWFNPAAGSGAGTGNITANGGSRSFSPPFSGDAVLYLKKTSTNPYCGDYSCNGAETCSNCPNDCGLCISTNPVAHWKLDETSGITASDSSGNGNTGTLVNGPAWTAGKLGGALSFDGSDDYVNVGNPSPLQLTGAISITAWIYLDDLSATAHRIVSKLGVSGQRGWELLLDDDPNNNAMMRISSDGTDIIDAKQSTQYALSGQWAFIAGTYVPSTSLNLYINGALITSNTISIPTSQFNSNQNVNIGRGPAGYSPFDGLIDDVRIYNYALSAQEIQALYQNGSCIHKSDSNCNGCVSDPELTAFIDKWKVNNQDVTLRELIESIGLWKRGC